MEVDDTLQSDQLQSHRNYCILTIHLLRTIHDVQDLTDNILEIDFFDDKHGKLIFKNKSSFMTNIDNLKDKVLHYFEEFINDMKLLKTELNTYDYSVTNFYNHITVEHTKLLSELYINTNKKNNTSFVEFDTLLDNLQEMFISRMNECREYINLLLHNHHLQKLRDKIDYRYIESLQFLKDVLIEHLDDTKEFYLKFENINCLYFT